MPDADHDSLYSPQTIIALSMLAIAAGTVIGVFLKGESELLSTVVGFVLGTGFSAVANFYFGSAKSSQTKDAVLANIATTNNQANNQQAPKP